VVEGGEVLGDGEDGGGGSRREGVLGAGFIDVLFSIVGRNLESQLPLRRAVSAGSLGSHRRKRCRAAVVYSCTASTPTPLELRRHRRSDHSDYLTLAPNTLLQP